MKFGNSAQSSSDAPQDAQLDSQIDTHLDTQQMLYNFQVFLPYGLLNYNVR